MIRAVAVLALVVVTTASQPPSKVVPQAVNVDRNSEKNKASTGNAPLAVYNQTEPVIKTETSNQHTQDQHEKTSQDVVMWSAVIQALGAVVVAALTVVLIVVVRRQLAAYERPWVTISIAKANGAMPHFGFFREGQAYLFVEPVIRNIGKSLATGISITTRLVALDPNGEVFSPERLRLLRTSEPDERTFTLFPGEENNRIQTYKIVSREEIEAASYGDPEDGKPCATVVFMGVILYRFANSEDTHETQFAYLMGHKDQRSILDGGVLEAVKIGAPYSGDQIVWIKLPGDHAT
jgi:hypothetical protein